MIMIMMIIIIIIVNSAEEAFSFSPLDRYRTHFLRVVVPSGGYHFVLGVSSQCCLLDFGRA